MRSPAARTTTFAAALLAVAFGAVSGCGGNPDQRSEANYCTQVGNHLTDLNSPNIAGDGDVDRVLDSWRSVSRSAPIAVQAEWETMVANLETAITVDPGDPASMQLVADTARRSEPAANRVISYTQQRCGALIGSVAPTPTTVTPSTPDTSAPDTSAPDTATTSG
ncbi:MAG TPA: hypothetical protein PK020_19365 [Ilumatobacteraceae bacterium]|nr:hypothetical protein [Ilumatobacteraceae bacterium]HRB03984.1 hypothetical protein [Ilumatobacteraceae bacterium]